MDFPSKKMTLSEIEDGEAVSADDDGVEAYPQSGLLTTSGEASPSTASSATLNDLQPEMLEIIFSNLFDERSNTTLLKCREVNQRWKSIVDGMLERVCRQTFSTVQPLYQREKQFRCPLSPKIEIDQRAFGRPSACDIGSSICPRFIVSQGRRQSTSTNPFPSKSLSVALTHRTEEGPLYQKYSARMFMSNFGHQIKFLTITRKPFRCGQITYREADLLLILSRTPNLTGLRIDGVRVIPSRSRRKQVLLTGLPQYSHLVSLKIQNSQTEPGTLNTGLPFSSWPVKTYSKQLECLEVDNTNDPLTFEKYPKLKELKTTQMDLSVMLASESLPLRRLIISNVSQIIGNRGSFMQFASFVEKFAATLEHLEISLKGFEGKPKYLVKELGKASLNGLGATFSVFPKLKVFGIQNSTEDSDQALINQFFLPKFPKLEIIELLEPIPKFMLDRCVYSGTSHLYSRDIVESFLVQEKYWEVCSKLVIVRVVPNNLELEDMYEFRVHELIELIQG